MSTLASPRYWYRCRACGHSRACDWTDLPADLTGTCCNSCRSRQIDLYEIATRTALALPRPPALPRPLVPPVERWQCCHCGGGGLDSHGDTCPHCDGFGHC